MGVEVRAMTIPDNICFIDIETLPEGATVGMDATRAPGWEPPSVEGFVAEPERKTCPAHFRKPDAIERWEANESGRYSAAVRDAWLAAHEAMKAEKVKARKEWASGSLDGMRGRIACVSIAFGEGEIDVIECAEDEAGGLADLDAVMRRRKPRAIVAHYGIGFDFPFIQLRAVKHDLLGLARRFHQDKPWDGLLVDTKALWPMVRGSKGANLANVCAFLGIDHDVDNPITGADVLDAYIAGRWGDVVAHAAADVRDLRGVYRVLAQVRGL